MSVRILSGRTRRLLPHIVQEIGDAYRAGARCLLLVPEQFTLQAELELVERLRLPGFFDLDVLSPTRLTQRVFEAAGTPQRVAIDERGKGMVLRCALEELGPQLVFYRHTGGAGFVEKLSALIADCKRGSLTPQALEGLAQAASQPALRAKLLDAARIYAAYERRLVGHFVDGEDVQTAMRQRLAASGLLQGAQVWVYGFDMLTEQFARTLAQAASLAASLCVALVMDEPPCRDAALYTPVRASAARFARILDQAGIACARQTVDAPLAASETLQYLEQELYAYPAKPWAHPPHGLTLQAAATPFAEAHLAAARILALVRDEGLAWHEIAVQYTDATVYAGLLRHVFAQYGIPAYVDEKLPAARHPLPTGLLAALRCATRGWRGEDALVYIKSGFSGLAEEDVFALERYALEYGLRGTRWRQPLSRGPEDVMARIEPLRQAVAAPLAALQEGLRQANDADGVLRAIVAFLQHIRAYEALSAYEQSLLAAGMPSEAAHSAQVWQHLMRTLDQMHALLAGQRVRTALIADMLAAGLESVELAALPPAPRALVCGALGRVRTGAVRALLVLGLGDGKLGSGEPGLLTDTEKRQAEQLSGAHLGMDDAAKAQLARLDVLQAFTLPSESLWLSYPVADGSGAAQRPAMVCAQLRRIFPKLALQGGTLDEGGLAALCAPRPALDVLGPALRGALEGHALPPSMAAAYAFLQKEPWGQALSNVLAGLDARVEALPLPAGAAATQAEIRYSVTRLETFAACPYKHFVQYALRPRPIIPCGVYPNDLGSWYHAALESYTRLAMAQPGWPRMERTQSDALMRQAISAVLADARPAWGDAQAQVQAQIRRIQQTACRAAWAVTQQLQQGQYMPAQLEMIFGEAEAPPLALPMAGEPPLYLRGRVDRIDLWQPTPQDAPYLRVVDYKAGAGTHGLDGARIYWGLQQQLLLYMAAALAAVPGARPGGLYYFRVHDPLVNTFARDEAQAERLMSQELRMRGLALGEAEALQALGLPGAFNRDGSLSKRAAAATPYQLHLLLAHAKRRATQFAGRIRTGDIGIAPARLGAWCACDTCRWASVCGIDPALSGGAARHLSAMRMDALLDKLEAEDRG
ncbi:MAG: PD-(D/E)XK nuclease family protein [Oscillospiraceae bacterium]|nr:PD-(D/E)XK nuclease family protein [Oscillospiraceae bacterium]